ncbi:hypothetical protein E2C01_096529 [Portunus trituberculatus]|uniref:Uncharacterized protein n=1 Tax=Portunus trituberculatus TaxID=210409 RepID=A0A5B7K793_PORTR|nr:hypothetical protein [Portunus trituberculatus]
MVVEGRVRLALTAFLIFGQQQEEEEEEEEEQQGSNTTALNPQHRAGKGKVDATLRSKSREDSVLYDAATETEARNMEIM